MENKHNVQAEEKKICDENMQTEEKKNSPNCSINRAIIGGSLGAGMGLLVNSKTTKKVMETLGESELVKVASHEFKKTAHKLLTGQVQNSIRQLAEGCINTIESGLLSTKKERSSSEINDSKEKNGHAVNYEKIKEENRNLNERLERIEKMLNDLMEVK
ncbi:gas vesicle protein GvpP [Neobacillus vireti]|uniref:gas vesicle protein GvpP n=1 Tax=Neobacillus vireti TaxID=220686 RepID=UPI0030001108